MSTFNLSRSQRALATLNFPSFPREGGNLANCRCVQILANYTPKTAVIFINQSREELGVL
jgi:hypothetical protein